MTGEMAILTTLDHMLGFAVTGDSSNAISLVPQVGSQMIVLNSARPVFECDVWNLVDWLRILGYNQSSSMISRISSKALAATVQGRAYQTSPRLGLSRNLSLISRWVFAQHIEWSNRLSERNGEIAARLLSHLTTSWTGKRGVYWKRHFPKGCGATLFGCDDWDNYKSQYQGVLGRFFSTHIALKTTSR